MQTEILKYVKKPVMIEAVQWNGNNIDTMRCFMKDGEFWHHKSTQELIIKTLEGDHIASKGDYIIKGVKGEFYPCKEDIFKMTYREAL